MAYNKHTWSKHEVITAEKLNNLEAGIAYMQENLEETAGGSMKN